MSALDWITLISAGGIVAILLLTDRWGHFIGTHNWRVSRRMDRDRGEFLLPMSGRADDAERDHARSMLACPYYHDPDNGVCEYGCATEPECQTCEPTEGWLAIASTKEGGRDA